MSLPSDNSQIKERSEIRAPTCRKENDVFIICESRNYPARHNYFRGACGERAPGNRLSHAPTCAKMRFEVID